MAAKDDGKLLASLEYLGLTRDLGRKSRMGKARCGENREFLPRTSVLSQVDRRDTGLDELVSVNSREGVS
jgi:hypothetical protein